MVELDYSHIVTSYYKSSWGGMDVCTNFHANPSSNYVYIIMYIICQ